MLAAINWPLVVTAIPAGLFYVLFFGLLIRRQLRAGPKGNAKQKLDPRVLLAMTVTLTGAVFFTCFALIVHFY